MAECVEIGPCRLWLGDCLQLLADGVFDECDAVVTDPPYGISHPCNYGERGRGIMWPARNWPDVVGDNQKFDPGSILKLNVATVLWGANYYSELLTPQSGWLVWDKEKPPGMDQSECELAWTNCIKGVRIYRHMWNGMLRASEKGDGFHPMQKPVALAEWMLSLPWLQHQVIADPYMGAGWIAVACIRTGRRFVGCEIEPRYFEIACKRVRQAWQLKCSELPFEKPAPLVQRSLIEE